MHVKGFSPHYKLQMFYEEANAITTKNLNKPRNLMNKHVQEMLGELEK
jgi:hypothetical protein